MIPTPLSMRIFRSCLIGFRVRGGLTTVIIVFVCGLSNIKTETENNTARTIFVVVCFVFYLFYYRYFFVFYSDHCLIFSHLSAFLLWFHFRFLRTKLPSRHDQDLAFVIILNNWSSVFDVFQLLIADIKKNRLRFVVTGCKKELEKPGYF